jgi:hypothetical protein
VADVPRDFHFVFGLKPQDEPFHLAHYLCLASCRQTQQPRRIFFHHRHLPFGPWWDRIAPHLTLVPVSEAPEGFAPERYGDTPEGRFIAHHRLSYAHEADFIRLDALIAHGGVYADMDTLFARPYPDAVFAHECVIGEEAPNPDERGVLRPSLCNAVIAARPGARYLRRWRERAIEVFDGTWSRHSCQAAAEVWCEEPSAVHVAPRDWFYRFGVTRASLAALFEQDQPRLGNAYSFHLWSHLWWSEQRRDFSDFHAGLLTEDYVRAGRTTYARIARAFL